MTRIGDTNVNRTHDDGDAWTPSPGRRTALGGWNDDDY